MNMDWKRYRDEWNRSNPDDYVYLDQTFRRWARRVFGSWFVIGPDVDSNILCPYRECGEILAICEETRDSEHDITFMRRASKQWGTAGFLLIMDGNAPKRLLLIAPGDDDEHLRQIMDRESPNGSLLPVLASGQIATRLQLGTFVLRHLLREHGPCLEAQITAEQLQIEIADLPE